MKKIVLIMLFSLCFIISAYSKPNVAVVDFKSIGLSGDVAIVVTEIFRSKIIISNEFTVIERNELSLILEEQHLQLSGLIEESNLESGSIYGIDYIISGKLMKIDSKVLLSIKTIDIQTAEIVSNIEKEIENMDVLEEQVKDMVATLVSEITGKEKFTYSTQPEGWSIELGGNFGFGQSWSEHTDNNNPNGFGFTVGFADGEGNFWSGFYSSWTFISETYNAEYNKILTNSGMILIFGNKVESFAFELNLGMSYDFALGMFLSPIGIGGYYKNFFIRYRPSLNMLPASNEITGFYNTIEAGYSIFLGTIGKEETKFY
jgi:hypothetical protein